MRDSGVVIMRYFTHLPDSYAVLLKYLFALMHYGAVLFNYLNYLKNSDAVLLNYQSGLINYGAVLLGYLNYMLNYLNYLRDSGAVLFRYLNYRTPPGVPYAQVFSRSANILRTTAQDLHSTAKYLLLWCTRWSTIEMVLYLVCIRS